MYENGHIKQEEEFKWGFQVVLIKIKQQLEHCIRQHQLACNTLALSGLNWYAYLKGWTALKEGEPKLRSKAKLKSNKWEIFLLDLRNVSFSVYSHDFICLTDETIDHKYIRFYICMSRNIVERRDPTRYSIVPVSAMPVSSSAIVSKQM